MYHSSSLAKNMIPSGKQKVFPPTVYYEEKRKGRQIMSDLSDAFVEALFVNYPDFFNRNAPTATIPPTPTPLTMGKMLSSWLNKIEWLDTWILRRTNQFWAIYQRTGTRCAVEGLLQTSQFWVFLMGITYDGRLSDEEHQFWDDTIDDIFFAANMIALRATKSKPTGANRGILMCPQDKLDLYLAEWSHGTKNRNQGMER